MYLKQLHIENNGPIRDLRLELPFHANGAPRPVILVGKNGSGKTNFLSIVADAFFSAASKHYVDIMPTTKQRGLPYFRVVGGATTTHGAAGSFTVLQFEHDGASYLFTEKSGSVEPEGAKARVSEALRPAVTWSADHAATIKNFAIKKDRVDPIFDAGVYLYFPSGRAEIPHWLNIEGMPSPGFALDQKIIQRFNKQLYVERALEQFQQWLLAALIDARVDVIPLLIRAQRGELGPETFMQIVPPATAFQAANALLKIILDDPAVNFGWLGRSHATKICIAASQQVKVPLLRGLSAGQSSLLAIFGTILSYGDAGGHLAFENIKGICLVDEIDAHMHVDLQYRAVPELMRLFPNVQFIVSCHSPLFVLGMEKKFGADGIAIIDMPSGTRIEAEAYEEFGHALKVLENTKAFAAEMAAAAAAPGKPLVFLEGETDPKYLRAAGELLGRQALLDQIEIEWVGAKDPESGQGFQTGKSGLDKTALVLRANPQLIRRIVILLYDNDAKKPIEDYGTLHTRMIPSNPENTEIESGIENLLPAFAIPADMFSERTENRGNGTRVTIREVKKMKLCTHLCEEKRDPSDFVNFQGVLDMIAGLAGIQPEGEVVSDNPSGHIGA